jgi:hypothetical protein
MMANIFVFFATLIVFAEEWIWFKLLRAMQRIASFPIFKQIEAFIRKQNKWVSLFLFIIPELAFIPVKLAMVWLIGNNHAYFGVMLFIAAKLTGTALFAWMYSVTEDKITQFAFVCFIRDKFLALRTWAHDWLHQQPAYLQAKNFIHAIKTSKEHKLIRRFRAAMALAKSNRDKA